MNNNKKNVRGYEHLLSPKAKKIINSPLLTHRSAGNLSPKTVKENVYARVNEAEIEENRSVKFIAQLREQISSNKNVNQCSRVTKKP